MPHIVKNNATGSTYGAFPSLADAQAHQARLDKQWKRAKKTEPSPWSAQTV